MRSENEEEKSLFQLLLRMLDYEPTQRIELCEAAEHAFFSPVHRTSPVRQTDQSVSPVTDDNDDVTTDTLPVMTS